MKLNQLVISALFPLAAMASFSASAESVIKDFTATGSVIGKPCNAELAQSFTIPEASPKDIHSSKVLPNSSQSATIILTLKNCTTGNITASIIGTAAEYDNKGLKIDDVEGSAKNVAIAFWDHNLSTSTDVLVPVNTGQTHTVSTKYGEDSRLILMAGLIIDNVFLPTTAGTVSAKANLQVNYL